MSDGPDIVTMLRDYAQRQYGGEGGLDLLHVRRAMSTAADEIERLRARVIGGCGYHDVEDLYDDDEEEDAWLQFQESCTTIGIACPSREWFSKQWAQGGSGDE